MVMEVVLSINESYWLDFLKVVIWNHSMKGTMTGFFRRAPFMVFFLQKLNKNEIFKQLALSTNKTFWLRLSPSSCFKLLNESSNDQVLS